MFDITLLKDASEVLRYNNPNIPLYVRNGRLSMHPKMGVLCHWHEDIEFTRPLKGHMAYNINGKKLLIEEGDAIMVNARQMHNGYSDDGTESR